MIYYFNKIEENKNIDQNRCFSDSSFIWITKAFFLFIIYDFDKNKSLDDILFKDIFEPRSKICDQKECFLYNKFILNINYSVIILPKILILNCDMGIFQKLIVYKLKIDDIFKDKIIINNLNCELIWIIIPQK